MDPNDPYQEGYTVGDIWAPRDATAPRTLKGIN
jgi:hypothetical protein